MKSIILSLLFLSGCISIDVVEPRVCDTTVVAFSSPAQNQSSLAPLTQSFTIDVGLGNDFLTKVLLIDGQLTRANGGSFDFIDEIMISVSNSSGDDLVLWDSQGPHNAGTVLPIKASDKNLVDYIDSNNKFTINFTISTQQPPIGDWSINAELCVSAEANKKYGL